MQALVFVPGTMGTELCDASGDLLWPPTPLETQFGYGRIAELLAEGVKPRDIVRSVACFGVYEPLLDQLQELKFTAQGSDRRLYPFPYDWRADLEQTADRLAALLDRAHAEGAREIHIVAHSMGGLISRLVLETGRYDSRPWFGNLRSFLALASPHQGAPLALARILGLDSTLGVSKSGFRRLTNDERYPSAYQLLPAPTERACWDQQDLSVGALDIYDPAVAAALGLNARLMARARWVHDSLAAGQAPAQVRYFYFAGTGHETVTRVNVVRVGDHFPVEEMVLTRTEDAGDGTVPFWSALPRPVQKQVVVNEHMRVFRGLAFKRVFYRLLGGDLGVPLQSMGRTETDEGLQLSMATPVVEAGHGFELLLVPSGDVERLAGRLVIHRLAQDGKAVDAGEDLTRVSYEGPAISRLRVRMPALAEPGLYRMSFVGTPARSDPLPFAVASLGD